MVPAHRYYYLRNFQRALTWVDERYGDLLDDVESGFIAQFFRLPELSQALLARLLMRRGPWFRASTLHYDEIPEIMSAARPLLRLGWLQERHPMRLDELFALHTKSELLQLFHGTSVHARMRKPEMLEQLLPSYGTPRPYTEWTAQTSETAWRVTVDKLCERLRLMFFGNLHQQWSEFVLADLGIFKYEAVNFDAASRAFKTRADVDAYLNLQTCRLALDEGADVDHLLLEVERCDSPNLWIQARHAKLLWRIGQACERVQDWRRAEQAYARSNHPGARHRRIRVYERMGRVPDAMALAAAAMDAPESEEESQRIARMLPRLRRHLGLGQEQRTSPPDFVRYPEIALELEPPNTPAPVEYAVRQHWHAESAPVFYVENALINSLFGLLCWPAIFAALPGAFFHPFQNGPADLGAADFAHRRAKQFGACLDTLDDGSYREIIWRTYKDKQDIQSPFVFWGVLNDDLIKLSLDFIPASHLRAFFGRLLQGVRANRSGLPDLIRFWPAENRYEMVEVKGPGDRLQDNQIRWLQFCMAQGIPVRVCHVRWSKRSGAMAGHATVVDPA